MRHLSFKRHRFPPEIIRHSIWLYARFTLSFRDVEEMLAERGLDVSYETIHRWVLKFGSATEGTDAYLKQWREVIDPVIETTENAGYNSEFPTLVRNLLNHAIEQGWGEHDIGALIKILRTDKK